MWLLWASLQTPIRFLAELHLDKLMTIWAAIFYRLFYTCMYCVLPFYK